MESLYRSLDKRIKPHIWICKPLVSGEPGTGFVWAHPILSPYFNERVLAQYCIDMDERWQRHKDEHC
jgi:hypothetical protein